MQRPTFKRYLSRPEIAERIGVQKDTLNRYKLPEPDAQIGARQLGWLPETIDEWNASRRKNQPPRNSLEAMQEEIQRRKDNVV